MSRPPFPSGWSHTALHPRNLTLANTLPVGQSFLWHRRALKAASVDQPCEEFSRAISDPPRVICLRQTPTRVYYTTVYPEHGAQIEDEGTTRRWMEDYFQLGRYPDLEGLYKDWSLRDPALFGRVEVSERAVGVRVLRQDPWECLIAFITSTNNHIPRITSLLHRLAKAFSPPLLTLDEHTYHLFPRPDALPDKLEALLRELGFGYRAAFIESSLQTLRRELGGKPGDIDRGLHLWRELEVDDVRDRLIALKGVGRKVADCVMLMCMDKPSLIPIDTHVAAIAARHPSFPSRLKNKPMSKQVYDETQGFLLDKWGPMGGWCQAVMFAADLPAARPKIVQSVAVKRVAEEAIMPELKRTRSATRRVKMEESVVVTTIP